MLSQNWLAFYMPRRWLDSWRLSSFFTFYISCKELTKTAHILKFQPFLQERDANVTINAVHPGIVKTAIIRAHRGFITGMNYLLSHFSFNLKENAEEDIDLS